LNRSISSSGGVHVLLEISRLSRVDFDVCRSTSADQELAIQSEFDPFIGASLARLGFTTPSHSPTIHLLQSSLSGGG
jgi:hypothetical protein